MSSLVKRNRAYLELYAQANGDMLKNLAENITKSQLVAITEITLNYLHGVIQSPHSFKRNLKFLKVISDTKVPLNFKRKLLRESRTYRHIIRKLLSSVQNQLWSTSSYH